MFPVALDLGKLPVLLIGEGEAFERRHRQLLEYGASSLSLWERAGGEGYSKTYESRITNHESRIILITGLSRPLSEQLAGAARAAGKLVNVEDENDLCDFYFTANVKRGDLIIAVSTSGTSPTLSRRIRDYIAGIFPEEWKSHAAEIAELRRKLKSEGKSMKQIVDASDEFLAEKGLLKPEGIEK